eukprot:g35578.t1
MATTSNVPWWWPDSLRSSNITSHEGDSPSALPLEKDVQALLLKLVWPEDNPKGTLARALAAWEVQQLSPSPNQQVSSPSLTTLPSTISTASPLHPPSVATGTPFVQCPPVESRTGSTKPRQHRFLIPQQRNGPCGVLTAIQARLLQHILYPDLSDGSHPTSRAAETAPTIQLAEASTDALDSDSTASPFRGESELEACSRTEIKVALLEAVLDALWDAAQIGAASEGRKGNLPVLVLPYHPEQVSKRQRMIDRDSKNSDSEDAGQSRSDADDIPDFLRMQLGVTELPSRTIGKIVLRKQLPQLLGPGGVVFLVYSLVMSRHLTRCRSDMKLSAQLNLERDRNLIIGAGPLGLSQAGFCTTAITNLALYGTASFHPSLPYDHLPDPDRDAPLRIGAYDLSFFHDDFSMLVATVFRYDNEMDLLTPRPVHPIWVVLLGGHSTVMFTLPNKISENKSSVADSTDAMYWQKGAMVNDNRPARGSGAPPPVAPLIPPLEVSAVSELEDSDAIERDTDPSNSSHHDHKEEKGGEGVSAVQYKEDWSFRLFQANGLVQPLRLARATLGPATIAPSANNVVTAGGAPATPGPVDKDKSKLDLTELLGRRTRQDIKRPSGQLTAEDYDYHVLHDGPIDALPPVQLRTGAADKWYCRNCYRRGEFQFHAADCMTCKGCSLPASQCGRSQWVNFGALPAALRFEVRNRYATDLEKVVWRLWGHSIIATPDEVGNASPAVSQKSELPGSSSKIIASARFNFRAG